MIDGIGFYRDKNGGVWECKKIIKNYVVVSLIDCKTKETRGFTIDGCSLSIDDPSHVQIVEKLTKEEYPQYYL